MNITFRGQNRDYNINVAVRRLPEGDGICQHCGKTRITRLATITFPVEVFDLLRDHDQAAQIEAIALLSGQEVYQLKVGLVCLGKFFAQFSDTIDRFLIESITKAAGRIERYATLLEKLKTFDLVRVAGDIWDHHVPSFEQLFRRSDNDDDYTRQTIVNRIYWTCDEFEKKHPWLKLASNSKRAIRYQLWCVAKKICAGEITPADLPTIKAKFGDWLQKRAEVELTIYRRKLQHAENVHLMGSVAF